MRVFTMRGGMRLPGGGRPDRELQPIQREITEMTTDSKFPFNVYWTVPECEIPYSEMSDTLVKCGFASDEIPEPTMRQQTARCVKSFHCLRGQTRTLADAAGETEKSAVYALLDRSSGSNDEEVSYREDTRITYDKENCTVEATGVFGTEFMARLNDRFIGKVSADDIRAFLLRVVSRSSGVPKRPTGGIYIVPGRFRPVFEQAQTLLRSLGRRAELYIERVYMGDEESANIQASVCDFVNRRVSEIAEKADKYVRGAAVDGLKDDAQKLREINELFSEALDIQALTDEVAQKVEGIGDTLNQAMAAIADAKKAKVADRSHSATPLEAAEKVAEELSTMEGECDFDTMATILKAQGFISKPSTLERRVRKAVADGYGKLVVTATGYRLASEGDGVVATSLPKPEDIPDEVEVEPGVRDAYQDCIANIDKLDAEMMAGDDFTAVA